MVGVSCGFDQDDGCNWQVSAFLSEAVTVVNPPLSGSVRGVALTDRITTF